MRLLVVSFLAEEWNAGGVWGSGVGGEVADGVDALLGGGAQHAHDGALSGRSSPGPVAAPYFCG